MRVRRALDTVNVELQGAEARALLEELSDVRGGSRLPKIRQMCDELEKMFRLWGERPPAARTNLERKTS